MNTTLSYCVSAFQVLHKIHKIIFILSFLIHNEYTYVHNTCKIVITQRFFVIYKSAAQKKEKKFPFNLTSASYGFVAIIQTI